MLYQDTPSHYNGQLAAAKGQLLHTAAQLKVSSHIAGRCRGSSARSVCVSTRTGFQYSSYLPSSEGLTTGFHKISRSRSEDYQMWLCADVTACGKEGFCVWVTKKTTSWLSLQWAAVLWKVNHHVIWQLSKDLLMSVCRDFCQGDTWDFSHGSKPPLETLV